MPDRPIYFAQEKNYSCAVACLRMVLSAFGILKTEVELRELCDCGLEGTFALNIVDVAKRMGLKGTQKQNLTIEELIAESRLGKTKFPIVYVRTRLKSSSIPTQHAYVVIEANRESVTVFDPRAGELTISTDQFEREWQLMRGLTILCQK